ncbi:MAG: hypothetical protein ABH821_05615 [archaeon]
MQLKGIVFSLESLITLTILLLIVLQSMPSNSNLEDLIVLQKSNDLLKVWCKEKSFDLENMKKDFKLIFPENQGVIELSRQKLNVNSEKSFFNLKRITVESYCSERLKLTVHY